MLKQKLKYALVWMFGAVYASSLWWSFTVNLDAVPFPMVFIAMLIDVMGSFIIMLWLAAFFSGVWNIDTKEVEEDDNGNKDKKVERKSGSTGTSKTR